MSESLALIEPLELHPPGFRFEPTDEELLGYYLFRKVQGLPLNTDGFIGEMDVYACEPWLLNHFNSPYLLENIWIYFVRRKRVSGTNYNCKRIRRTVQGNLCGGWWHSEDKEIAVLAKRGDRVLGYKRNLVFFTNKKPRAEDQIQVEQQKKKQNKKKDRGERTQWLMDEYRLDSDTFQEWVICRIRYKGREPFFVKDPVPAEAAHMVGDSSAPLAAVENDEFADPMKSFIDRNIFFDGGEAAAEIVQETSEVSDTETPSPSFTITPLDPSYLAIGGSELDQAAHCPEEQKDIFENLESIMLGDAPYSCSWDESGEPFFGDVNILLEGEQIAFI